MTHTEADRAEKSPPLVLHPFGGLGAGLWGARLSGALLPLAGALALGAGLSGRWGR